VGSCEHGDESADFLRGVSRLLAFVTDGLLLLFNDDDDDDNDKLSLKVCNGINQYYIDHFPLYDIIFIIISSSWVRLSPFGTSATNWPTVPAPDDR
jgi:hypothetical protein